MTFAIQQRNLIKMEKRIINPWNWQDERSYVQAVEVKNVQATLYVSGQTAIDNEGISSHEDLRSQLLQSIQNIEKVVLDADYEIRNIVKLNIYTSSTNELLENFDIVKHWIEKHNIKQAMTVLEVKNLFETLKIELEVTVVK